MPPGMRNCKRLTAFTLIEMVVALGLGILLLVVVQQMTVQAYHTARIVQDRADEATVHGLPVTLLREDLAQLPPGGGVRLEECVLSLVTTNALQSQRVATRHAVTVAYRVAPSDAIGLQLVREESELGKARRKSSGVILVTGLQQVDLEVFDGRQWHRRWPLRMSRSATALRITIQWPNGERQQSVLRLEPLQWRRHDA